MYPSTAIAHYEGIVPLKDLIVSIVEGAEEILKSWGFKSNEFDSTLIYKLDAYCPYKLLLKKDE